MNELLRLRGSERYGACADDSAGCRVLFSKGGPAGELPAGNGAAPHTPSESPRHLCSLRLKVS